MGFFERLFGKPESKKGSSKKVQKDDLLKVEGTEVAKPEKKEDAPVKETIKKEEIVVDKEETKANEATATSKSENKNPDASTAVKDDTKKDVKKTEAKKTTATKKAEASTSKSVKEEKSSIVESSEKTVSDNAPVNTPEETTNEVITGRFEINRSKDGKKYFFNLYASNKVGIATSQMYSSAQSALIGIKSVIANAATAPIEDQSLKKYEELPFPKWIIYVDKGGKYRFHLCATNGSNVCHSQGYTTKAACKNGIESIIRSSKNAEIDKTYLTK